MQDPARGTPPAVDVLVIGGGVNGVSIARDLAGRGWSVCLCEKDDLAAHTSSASTKLIHGGLRYLEHGEFGLVRKALAERELLMRSAPHLMRPLRFVLPHAAHMRPAWMIRIGLLLYDRLARREWLPASAAIDLRRDPAGAALDPRWTRGFTYADGWVDDARLVALSAVDAAQRGARILTRTAVERVEPVAHGELAAAEGAPWLAQLRPRGSAVPVPLRARAVVNAAGPWASQVAAMAGAAPVRALRLIRGSHIVVPRALPAGDGYILQSPDRRVIFVLPFERRYTLIGTTDVEHRDSVDAVAPTEAEVDYLCTRVNDYLATPVRPADVVWSYAGVRPLLDGDSGEPSALTRDYALEFAPIGAPWLDVWGGKITTCRRLAQEAADRVGAALGDRRPAWTASATLPGGDLAAAAGARAQRPDIDLDRFVSHLGREVPWRPPAWIDRVARAYGSRALHWLRPGAGARALGDEIAPGLFEAELEHLWRHEWAREGDDVLWRRSKLGLGLAAPEVAAVRAWLAARGRR